MQAVEITPAQEQYIAQFLLENPHICMRETYLHTHSPFNNLRHYMWEELCEENHANIRQKVSQQGKMSDIDIQLWVQQEFREHKMT